MKLSKYYRHVKVEDKDYLYSWLTDQFLLLSRIITPEEWKEMTGEE